MSDLRQQTDCPRLVSSPPRVRDRWNSPRRSPAGGLSGIAGTIKTVVIPRLAVAHARPRNVATDIPVSFDDPALKDAAALAELMLTGDTDGAGVRVDALRAHGFALEDIYLQLLAPAAAYLRRLWNADLCGFAEATLALWRLQQLLRRYSVEFRAESDRAETGRRALLAPTPLEKHDLGHAMFYLVLISEFFRRDGWEAWIEPDPKAREFADVVRQEWFDVVEFLVSGDKQLDALASRIRMVRRESQNRSIGVMVCGQVFIEHPELVLLVGADLTATDARQGAVQAQQLVGLASCS